MHIQYMALLSGVRTALHLQVVAALLVASVIGAPLVVEFNENMLNLCRLCLLSLVELTRHLTLIIQGRSTNT